MILPVEDLDEAVKSAAAGDERTLGDVLETIRPLIVRYCRARISGDGRALSTADDIAQEACLAVMSAIPRYEDQGRPFMAFVYGITAHKVADARRSAARNKSDPTDDVPERMSTDGGPEQLALDSDANRRMRQLLSVLPDKQQEILVLRLIVGLSAEETADAVGSSPGAVRVAQHRALARLKTELNNTSDDAAQKEGENRGRRQRK